MTLGLLMAAILYRLYVICIEPHDLYFLHLFFFFSFGQESWLEMLTWDRSYVVLAIIESKRCLCLPALVDVYCT